MPKRETITTGNHVGLISSLPKWAADEIHRLDSNIARAERLLGEIGYDPLGLELRVAPRVRIASTLSDKPYNRVEAYYLADGGLEVSAMGMVIEPVAGNRVRIHQNEDYR